MIQRYNRLTRWFHAGTYVLTLVLLFTGWWLWRGEEGRRSVLAQAVDLSDVELHRRAGWALAGLAAAGLTLGARASLTFVRETLRVDRGDGCWLALWPRGAVSGRFGPHRGHFDPGQRLANLVFVATLGTLLASGIALTELHGGPTFAWVARLHRIASYALVPVTLGHVLLALGILPGYRGAWRAMHLQGRVPERTVRRLWPATLEEPDAAAEEETPTEVSPGARA